MRVRSTWHMLTTGELRLLMAGFADWERRSPPGPIRSRIRGKRLDAVAYYRRAHGALGEDRQWVSARLPNQQRIREAYLGRHDPRRERDFSVLWHET